MLLVHAFYDSGKPCSHLEMRGAAPLLNAENNIFYVRIRGHLDSVRMNVSLSFADSVMLLLLVLKKIAATCFSFPLLLCFGCLGVALYFLFQAEREDQSLR